MSDLVAALRELHLASGDKFSMWSKAADRIESLQMIYDDAEKQSAEARIELVIFKQGALARIERLESELAAANAYRAALKESKNGAIHIARKLSAELAVANAKIKAARMWHDTRYCAYCDNDEQNECHLRAVLESATPKPTDNSEDAT